MDYIAPSFKRFLAVTRSPYFFMLVLAFCVFSYFFLDRQLSLFLYSAITAQQYSIAKLVTKLGEANWYFIILTLATLFFRYIAKSSRGTQISLFLLLAIALPSIGCDIIKFSLGRTRPALLISEHLYQFTFFKTHTNYLSFPSGHSTLITGLMLGLCFVFNRFWLLFVLIFLLVSSTRIFIIAHYLTDVIGGMYLSLLIVPWIYNRWFSNALPPSQTQALIKI